jgi:hypothetical protein
MVHVPSVVKKLSPIDVENLDSWVARLGTEPGRIGLVVIAVSVVALLMYLICFAFWRFQDREETKRIQQGHRFILAVSLVGFAAHVSDLHVLYGDVFPVFLKKART